MSTRAATARRAPAPARRPAPARPPLTLVEPAPWRAPRAPFVVLALVIAAAGLLGLLVLNTVVAQEAFTLHDLDRRTARLAEQEKRLAREVAQLEAPAVLAARADALGLVPAGDPVFLRQPDGAVLGKPVPAKPKPSPVASVSPGASPAASASARPGAAASPRPATSPKASAQPAPRPSASASAPASPKPTPKPTPTPSAAKPSASPSPGGNG